MLDAQEYLHLAVNASQKGEHHASMEYLHKCLELQPENSDAIYLLAAEHAEIGLFDRAIEGMERAIVLDPAQEMAKFQVALLYLAQNNKDKAKAGMEKLNKATKDAALKHYSSALLRLIADEIELASQEIKKGLDMNFGNAYLDTSMRNILDVVVKQEKAKMSDTESDVAESKSVFLGAYKDKKLSDN